MRRALLSLLLVSAACGAPPAPAAPPPPPPPAAPQVKPVASIDLKADVVIARDAAGHELFRAPMNKFPVGASPAPDGGIYVVTSNHVMRLDDHGSERWKTELKMGGKLLAAPTFVAVSSDVRVNLFDPEDGSDRGGIGVDEHGITREGRAPTPGWSLPLRMFPGSPTANVMRRLAIGADGMVLAGANDGSLVAIDVEGKPRFQLGVRGDVRGIEAGPEGGFLVHTRVGAVAIDAHGAVLSEPSPGAPPTLAYRARRAAGGHVPNLVLAPDDAWSIETSYSNPREQKLYHHDGKAWRQVAMKQLGLLREPLLSGLNEFEAYDIAQGPEGRILVIGLDQKFMSVAPALESIALRVFERTGNTFRERADLAPAFEKTRQHMESNVRGPEYARGPGGREIFCVVDTCLARGLPASFRPGKDPAPVAAGAPPWVTFEWSGGGMWWQSKPLVFAGETLWRIDGNGLSRDGQVVFEGPQPEDLEREFGPVTGSTEPARALWASGPDDVWASIGIYDHSSVLMHWDGKELRRVPSPLRWANSMWGSGRDDLWIAGEGVAHFDGKSWHRVAGLRWGPLIGGGKNEVWAGGWHLTPDPSAQPDLEGTPSPAPPATASSLPVTVGPIEASVRLDRVSLDVAGDTPLSAALGVAEGPGGVVWLHDRHRIVEVDGTRVRLLHRAPPPEPLPCQRCLAPAGAGEGLFLAHGPDEMVALRSITAGRAADDPVWLRALLSIARSPDGAVWAVSASDDDGAPRVVVRGANGLRLVTGVPPAAYADVAPRAADDVWLAGGLAAFQDGTRPWPAGEGTLVHFDGKRFTRHRAPDGALLAVAAVGPAEAWAAGMDGSLVHVEGGASEAFHLEREGAPLRITLRAVAATGPDDVWIAGDRATLLHWDGKAWNRIDTSVAGHDVALTSVIPPRAAGPGWVVGPTGLWRIVRRSG